MKTPDGTPTGDIDLYVDSWRKLAAPLEEAYGWRIMAFDPGFQFDLGRNRTLSLPADVVRELSATVVELRATDPTANH